jgi:hypothetical protein
VAGEVRVRESIERGDLLFGKAVERLEVCFEDEDEGDHDGEVGEGEGFVVC